MAVLKKIILSAAITFSLISCSSGPPSYQTNVRSAHSGLGSVDVRFLSESVVLLSGRVEDHYTLMAIKRAAWKNDKVKQIINRIYVVH